MNHATRPLRLLSIVTALALLAPQAQAAPADDQQALAVFEAGFKEGQAKFDDGEFLAAARAWIAAARNLRETQSNRDNRAAVYEYVVDAFTSGLRGRRAARGAARGGRGPRTPTAKGFTRAYGTETPISAKIIGRARRLQGAPGAGRGGEQAAAGNEPAEGPGGASTGRSTRRRPSR
jgi:hypothetical protein